MVVPGRSRRFLTPSGRVRELVAQPPFFDAAALVFSFQVEKPQDRATAVAQTDPALHALHDLPLFIRNAVKRVNQFVDFGVGGGDFALEAVEFRRRGPARPCGSLSDRFRSHSNRLLNYVVRYSKAEVPPQLSDQGFWLTSETVLV